MIDLLCCGTFDFFWIFGAVSFEWPEGHSV